MEYDGQQEREIQDEGAEGWKTVCSYSGPLDESRS